MTKTLACKNSTDILDQFIYRFHKTKAGCCNLRWKSKHVALRIVLPRIFVLQKFVGINKHELRPLRFQLASSHYLNDVASTFQRAYANRMNMNWTQLICMQCFQVSFNCIVIKWYGCMVGVCRVCFLSFFLSFSFSTDLLLCCKSIVHPRCWRVQVSGALQRCTGDNGCFSVCAASRREMAELRAELDEEKLKRIALQVTLIFLSDTLGLSIAISPISSATYWLFIMHFLPITGKHISKQRRLHTNDH